jgi:hypothetical protein
MNLIDRIIGPENRKAFMIGVGSIFDLNGLATYQAMPELQPPTRVRTAAEIMTKTTRSLTRRCSANRRTHPRANKPAPTHLHSC